jgi:hypothetical protein
LHHFQSLKYKYFQVSQKLGAPTVSQPNTGVFRKNSAGSTQSDSKIIVSKAKATQKVAPKDDLFKAQQQQVSNSM